MRLAVTRPLQPAELFDRRVQSAIAAAATIVHRGPIAQVELDHPGGLAARVATTHGRHSGLADGSRIHVPGHNVIAGW